MDKIYEAIKGFNKQLEYEPEVINSEKLGRFERYIFVGIGGSALGPDLLRVAKPDLDILIHRDYGLPDLPDKVLQNSLIILNSYSGNTQEVLQALKEALDKSLTPVAISTGGKLLELAKDHGLPHIQTPESGQARLSLGSNLKALLKVTGQVELLTKFLKVKLDDYETTSKEVAHRIRGFIPIIYSSRKNGPLAYTWKVNINETAKKPAFSNVFPELNHNEIASFNLNKIIKLLSQNFYFVFLKDSTDHTKIQKSMDILEKMLKDRKLNIETVNLDGGSRVKKILSSVNLASWVAYHLAKEYNVDPGDTSVIEEFKKLIS